MKMCDRLKIITVQGVTLTLNPPLFFVLTMFLVITSSVSSLYYIQLHFRLVFIMKANTVNPDQTAPSDCSLGSSLIWVHSVCNTGYLRTEADERANDKSHDWREKG